MEKLEDILSAVLAGKKINYKTALFAQFFQLHDELESYIIKFNNEADPQKRAELLSKVFGTKLPKDTMIFPPLHTDFGRHIFIKEGVLINSDCLFDDTGGVYLDENVLVGPRVSFITLNHDKDPKQRDYIIPQAIHVRRNAWIGCGSVILPGITIGENAIVGAGSVVTKDVPANATVVGNPAHVLKKQQALKLRSGKVSFLCANKKDPQDEGQLIAI